MNLARCVQLEFRQLLNRVLSETVGIWELNLGHDYIVGIQVVLIRAVALGLYYHYRIGLRKLTLKEENLHSLEK